MLAYLNSPFKIGKLQFSNRLIQGPLAGFSCAPFRELFSFYQAPAYCVTEMISAQDIVYKPSQPKRYLYRSLQENRLCYQISGTNPLTLAQAARHLEMLGADLIDINCGCPKLKIRKKGAGSALLENSALLVEIVSTVQRTITCPLTVKIRIQQPEIDILLAKQLEEAGADALIVHGRHWVDDYDVACDLASIRNIKQSVTIPVIANGDIQNVNSLKKMITQTECDAFMISRAGTGTPWLYENLLNESQRNISFSERVQLFMHHLHALATLESDFKAILQSRSLVRYYFREKRTAEFLNQFYNLHALSDVEKFMRKAAEDISLARHDEGC